MAAVKTYVQTLGHESKDSPNKFVTGSSIYLLAQHLPDFYVPYLTTFSNNSTDSTPYHTSNMARTPRYHVSVYAILTYLMALSPLLISTQAMSVTSSCPIGSHPVLAAGSGNKWYSVCCSPKATIVATLTSDGPRCCTQPTLSDSLNLVPVSEWSTCTIIPVSAGSCAASRHEQAWNDFHLQICREADSPHFLFPPESFSHIMKSEDEWAGEPSEPAEIDATNSDGGLPFHPRQGTAQCPMDDSPVLVPSPDVRTSPVIACCNMLFNERAIQTATGIFCCLNGTDECDEPADDVLSCPEANAINVQPFDLLVCPSKKKRSEERDESQPASWCATHNDPKFCVRDENLHNEIDDAVEKRSECDIAPENGNCSSAAPRSLRCPSLVTLLSILTVVIAFFTMTTAADAGGAICQAGDTSVAGVIANGSDQYSVCCPGSHTRSVNINHDTGFSVCRNGQDEDYGLEADSVLGCSQPTDIVDIYGRGVFACKAGQTTVTTQSVTAHPSLVTAIPSNSASPIRRSPNSVTLWSAVFILFIFSIGTVSAQNVSNSDNTLGHQVEAAQTTTCPADAKAVSTIAVRDGKKDTYVVCCPSQTADMAAVNFANGKVSCCFGPLCAYPSVDVQRCDGGIDDMMSVGYEVGGRSVCLVTDKAERTLAEKQSDLAAYNICPSGTSSTAAEYDGTDGSYFACCPYEYSNKAVISIRHVYCCDSVDCAGSAVDALCADGAAPVEITGDKVMVCRIDEVGKRDEGSTRTDITLEKRKGKGGGGCLTCSAASYSRNLPSPMLLIEPAVLALVSSLTKTVAASDNPETESGEDAQSSDRDFCPKRLSSITC